MFRSGNPALKNAIFEKERGFAGESAMTISGTVNKTGLLLMLVVLSASWIWAAPLHVSQRLIFPAVIIGFIAGIVTIVKKEKAAITSPIYALLQGVFLGAISAILENTYPGIVIQAVALTFGTLLCMLFAYKSGIIRATEKFKLGVFAATGAIALIYVVSLVLRLFGVVVPMIHGSGTMGILFSVFVVTIAALNLVLDFDFIEKGSEVGAPRYMEWYAAFGLLVTLIWLYVEILRLLAKLNSRR